MRALVLVAVVDVAQIVTDYLDYDLVGRIMGGDVVSYSTVSSVTDMRTIADTASVVSYLVAAIFFILWIHRAYRNLDAIGGLRRWGAGWAIGVWFVPILAWFRPLEIVNDVWRGSDPDSPGRPPAGDERVRPLLTWWWAAFLVSSFVNNFVARLYFHGGTAQSLRSSDRLSIAGDALDLVAAVLAVAVVRATTGRQERRASARAEQGDFARVAAAPIAPSLSS